MSLNRQFKQRKRQTATFNDISFMEYEMLQNQEQKQFAQTLVKQSTIDKINALQFQNDTDNCRQLVDCLLKEYDLWHPQTQTTICDSISDGHNDISHDGRDINIDGIREYQNEDNINDTENSNIKLKSNIIFLELENKKLQLKQRLLEKKYQKESLQVKMAPTIHVSLQKKEKQLLEIELNLLKQIKQLTESLEDMKMLPIESSCSYSGTSSMDKRDSRKDKTSSKQKNKKLNKTKLLKYLIEKTDQIDSKEEFLQLLQKTQASLKA